MKFYKFSALLQNNGWMSPAFVGVDQTGLIRYLSEQPPSAEGIAVEVVNGYAIAGLSKCTFACIPICNDWLSGNTFTGRDRRFLELA